MSYTCNSCDDTSHQVLTAAILVFLAVLLLLVFVAIAHLVGVVNHADEGHSPEAWSPFRLLPSWMRNAGDQCLSAVKIVLVVWQIITQASEKQEQKQKEEA